MSDEKQKDIDTIVTLASMGKTDGGRPKRKANRKAAIRSIHS